MTCFRTWILTCWTLWVSVVPTALADGLERWPTKVYVDTSAGALVFEWPTDVDGVQQIAFRDVLQFERARAFEAQPDRLFAVHVDGRRVLVAMGDEVAGHSTLVPALTGRPLTTLAPTEWPVQTDGSANPPNLLVGSTERAMSFTVEQTSAEDMETLAPAVIVAPPPPAQPGPVSGQGKGRLSKESIDRVIKQGMNRFRGCFQQQLQRNPGLAGTVTMRFVIDRDGSVRAASVTDTTLANPAVESCIRMQLLATRFPQPKGNGTVNVTYPFMFRPN